VQVKLKLMQEISEYKVRSRDVSQQYEEVAGSKNVMDDLTQKLNQYASAVIHIHNGQMQVKLPQMQVKLPQMQVKLPHTQ
jgi:hypothetical protein